MFIDGDRNKELSNMVATSECTQYQSRSSSIFYSKFKGQKGWTLQHNGANYFMRSEDKCCPFNQDRNEKTAFFTNGADRVEVTCANARSDDDDNLIDCSHNPGDDLNLKVSKREN